MCLTLKDVFFGWEYIHEAFSSVKILFYPIFENFLYHRIFLSYDMKKRQIFKGLIDFIEIWDDIARAHNFSNLTSRTPKQGQLSRGDATGTAYTATAVPNIYRISSGCESFFYFVCHVKKLVGFPSHIPCLNSSWDKEYSSETRRDSLRDQRARFYYERAIMMCESDPTSVGAGIPWSVST